MARNLSLVLDAPAPPGSGLVVASHLLLVATCAAVLWLALSVWRKACVRHVVGHRRHVLTAETAPWMHLAHSRDQCRLRTGGSMGGTAGNLE